ncbi:MAG: phage major capsid protein [Proteobacteria bacterium]|nr:phage major capsid protein [Pseudomonadota bacterium]
MEGGIMEEQIKQILENIESLKGLNEKITTLEEAQKLQEAATSQAVQMVDSFRSMRKLGSFSEFDSEGEAKHFLTWMKDVMAQKADMQGDVDAAGGYLVPDEFLPTLVRIIYKYGAFRQGATVVPMSTDTLRMPTLASAMAVEWLTNQNDAITEVAPTIGEVVLSVAEMACLVPIANQLISDSALDVASMVATIMGEQVAKEEDRVAFVGDDSGTDPWDGIMVASGTSAVTMAAGSTHFTDLTWDNLADMTVAAEDDDGAVFCMHRTVLNYARKIKDGESNYIWTPPAGDVPATIWGYPYILSNVMPALTDDAADTGLMWFGNLRHAYLGNRQQMSIAASTHAGFAKNQTMVRMIERIAFALGNADAFAVLKTAAS